MSEKWKEMYDKYGEDLLPQSVIDDFTPIRAKVMTAVEATRRPIPLEEAKKQIELFSKICSIYG